MKAIRVLQVVAELGMGGIQSFLMNVYRNIDREQIQFDFLLSTDKVGVFEEEIEKMGGRIYRVTSRSVSFSKNKRELDAFFAEHQEYKCIHCHFSNLSYLMPLRMAKKHNVPVRIIHSHSTHLPQNPVHKILHAYNKKCLDSLATDFYTCSDLAGKWLFGGTKGYDNQVIVNNGIQTNKYIFNESIRTDYRNSLNLNGKVVIGAVGRLSEPKNDPFLLEVFADITQKIHNSVLVMVGDGPERNNVEEKIKSLNLEESVKLLGMRQDVPQLLQAFDAFLMPSKWEGFPVALLEAEAAGLPAYVSDTVTTQAKINSNVKYMPLSDGADKWGEVIAEDSNSWQRISTPDQIINAGFDIDTTVHFLEEKYFRSY